jgi:hypothetical protein
MGRLNVLTSMVVTVVDGKRDEVVRMEWMNVVTAGPARVGRVEAMMRAIFLDAMLEVVESNLDWECADLKDLKAE